MYRDEEDSLIIKKIQISILFNKITKNITKKIHNGQNIIAHADYRLVQETVAVIKSIC